LSGAVLTGAAIVTVELAVPPEASVRVIVLRDTKSGYANVERYTVPVNPLRLVAVISEVCVDPAAIVRDDGLADIEKSGDKFGETLRDGCGVVWDDEDFAEAGVATGIRIRNARPNSTRNFQLLAILRILDVR
jgi:hypothetical protein